MAASSASRETGGDPLADITRAVTRTLWILFAGFAFAVLSYLVLFVVTSGPTGRLALGSSPAGPAYWRTVQIVFLVAGIAALYGSFRLRAWLLDPVRLARRVADPRPSGAPPGSDPAGAAQELIGRIVFGHVLLWGLLEVPALLGVVDRIVGRESWGFVALITMSAIGLALHRPCPRRVAEILRAHFSR